MSQRLRHADYVRALMAHALAHGATRVHLNRVRWNMSENCEDPHTTYVIGRPGKDTGDKWGYITVTRTSAQPGTVELVTRCRKCAPCRKARSNLWRYRIKAETLSASRTWMGTLTLGPQHQFQMRSRARKKREDFDGLDEITQFKLVADQIRKEITLFLKRVRNNSNGVRFRYVVVCERHKSGLPHFHVLVHEPNLNGQIKWSTLTAAWRLGFSKFKLVDHIDGATYVAKYLQEDASSRVMASQKYGQLTHLLPESGKVIASVNDA